MTCKNVWWPQHAQSWLFVADIAPILLNGPQSSLFPGIPTIGQSSSTVGGADLWNQWEDDVWLPKTDHKRHPGFASFALGLLILGDASRVVQILRQPMCPHRVNPGLLPAATEGEDYSRSRSFSARILKHTVTNTVFGMREMKRHMHPSVQSSTVDNSQDMEAT